MEEEKGSMADDQSRCCSTWRFDTPMRRAPPATLGLWRNPDWEWMGRTRRSAYFHLHHLRNQAERVGEVRGDCRAHKRKDWAVSVMRGSSPCANNDTLCAISSSIGNSGRGCTVNQFPKEYAQTQVQTCFDFLSRRAEAFATRELLDSKLDSITATD